MQPTEVPPAPARLHASSRLLMALIALAAVVMLLAVFRLNPAEHSFFPRCFFHTWTGLDCPGCGGQRAVHHLLRGHLAVALRCNALFVSLLPVAAWYLTRFILHRTSGYRLPSPFWHHAWPWILAGLVIAFGIVRNLPGCEWLRP